jgi:hypothetical protein
MHACGEGQYAAWFMLSRLTSVALVSRRMYSVAVSPALLEELTVDLDKATSARRARALLPWLGRHASAVRYLDFQLCAEWSGSQEPYPFTLSAACLTAACMAAQLRQLRISNTPLSTLAFLPLVAGSLEALMLEEISRLQIDVSLSGMTRLTYLELVGGIGSERDVRLPPNLAGLVCSSVAPLVNRLLSQVRQPVAACLRSHTSEPCAFPDSAFAS